MEEDVVESPKGTGANPTGTPAAEDPTSLPLKPEEFLSCIELSSDGFCIMDCDTTILFVNEIYEKITGLTRKSILGRTMRELVQLGFFDRSVGAEIQVTHKPASLTLKLSTDKTVLVSGRPLFNEKNELSRIICSIRDITELNLLQSKLESMGAEKARYEQELAALKTHSLGSENIIFRSAALQRIVELALRIGPVDSTILLQGESGVGKELLADFIQKNSSRAHKPFLKVNCGAIPEQLLESELFGYARGAFTGANKEGKIGLFEAASSGTILLDEVGELPKQLQVKLLRVLQEKKIRRIGDTIDRKVDVRIIAATNRDLAGMVTAEDFRKDLYYRLNVVPMTIPPLRERREDIFPLVQSFLNKFNELYKMNKKLLPRVISALLEYSWPGNVRELENLMERLVVTSEGNLIDLPDLPDDLFHDLKQKLYALPVKSKNLREIMDAYEAKILQDFFSQYRTSREVAAALGVHQSNIIRKIKKLHLENLLEAKGRKKVDESDKEERKG